MKNNTSELKNWKSKLKNHPGWAAQWAGLCFFLLTSAFCLRAPGQGTAFTYQGRLDDGASPASGQYDLRFTVYDSTNFPGSIIAGPLTNSATGVSNGLFTVTLDFGAGVFTGADRFLEIGVRTNAPASFNTLAPRQKLTPAPYAIYATLARNLPDTVTQQFNGLITFGAGIGAPFVVVSSGHVANLNADLLDGLDSTAFALVGHNHDLSYWKLTGNAGTTPGLNFLGTTDNQALELKVNNARALRLEPTTNAPNIIGGYSGNTVTPGVYGAFIGGGGTALQPNNVGASLGVIGGGRANTIALNSAAATIAGGEAHDIRANASGGAIGGGVGNDIAEDSQYVTIPGGFINRVATNSGYSTIGGGGWHVLGARSSGATIAGGILNSLADETDYGAIGGGTENDIAQNSLASTIAGGRWNAIGTSSGYSGIGGGYSNTIAAGSLYATIAGGFHGEIGANSDQSSIGGGWYNNIADNSFSATIAGGSLNAIRTNSDYCAIGGGWNNYIADNSPYATIAAGRLNFIGTNSDFSAIGGGYDNGVAANAVGVTIAGGWANDVGSDSYSSSIGGGYDNNIATNSNSSTIGGGYNNNIASLAVTATIGGGEDNDVGAHTFSGAIGGGWNNEIRDLCDQATIAGGSANRIGTNSSWGAIGGGFYNWIANDAPDCTIAGGSGNDIGPASRDSAIGGGLENSIAATSYAATIAGGDHNSIAANSEFATIPGGSYNTATNYAFAAGRQAKARHSGAFAWADSSAFDFSSTANNQFNVRAVGGVRIVTGIDGAGAPDAGVSLNADDSSWNVISDRNAKKNFRAADVRGILERLAQVSVQFWNYKWEPDGAVPHLGPMAQDFKAAFYPGRDDKTISTLEADGVALAAIQGLNQKLTAELKQKETEIAKLNQRLDALEKIVLNQKLN